MTHVLIVEADPELAGRLCAVLTRERITVVAGAKEAVEAIANGVIHIGVASSAVFRDKLAAFDLRLVPWVVLTDSIDDELAIHHNAPEINAQFLVKDEQERYFELLPLRVRMAKSRERLVATIADQFPGMVAYWNVDERCQFANAAYQQWFGVTMREMLGKSLRDLLGPIYLLNEPYIRGALRGEAQRFERAIPNPTNGQVRQVLAIYMPDIEDGVVHGFVALATEITKEYHLQQALLERERRWATLFEILPVGVTVIDDNGAIVEMNSAIQTILGLDRQELEQGKFRNRTYVDTDGRPLACSDFPNVRALAERRIVGPVEIGVIRENQTTVWTSVLAAPFPGEDKAVVITRDTTAEKASAARFESIVGASPIPYALNDAQGNITYVNRAFVTTFGYTIEDIPTLAHWWPQAYPDPTHRTWVAAEWTARLERSKRDNVPFEPMELAIRAKDGTEKLAMVSAVALEGSLAGEHLVVLVDVTERKRAERQLEESRRLASLGALAGGIAHDFNNLLTPILAHIDIALAEIPPQGFLHNSLSEVRIAARRAAALVRQILAVSRPGDESKTRVDLVPLVDEVVHLLRASLPSNISIQTQIESQGSSLLANPSRIHQVILNLATNARDAMGSSGGVLMISVNRTEGNHVKLSVSDTGSGILPELLDRVFEPYFTTKMSSGGTGLGLATVRAIVTSLGGTITIHSELGKGTTVNVLFPTLEDDHRPVSRASDESMKHSVVNGQGLHVLVVDDEPMVARAAGRMLTRLGYRTTLAHNPVDAIAAFQSDPSFAVVLTDYTMPGMTGLDLAKTLFQIRPICILIATGLAECLTEEKIRAANVRQILMKPYGMAALSDALAAGLLAKD